MKPPMPGTEAEKLWIKEDKPIPFDPATGEESVLVAVVSCERQAHAVQAGHD
jgi:hypothetical protein